MPTYEYACRSCGEHLEVVQSFKDDPLTTCPSCKGDLKKVFSAAGIIFKGSGWHIKDYGSTSSSPAASSSSESSTSDSSASSEGASTSASSGSDAGGASTSDSGSSSGSGSSEAKSA